MFLNLQAFLIILPHDKILVLSKFKALADGKFSLIQS